MTILSRAAAAAVLLVTTVCLAGCGGSDGMPAAGTVRGTVKYKGQPVSVGSVIFRNDGGKEAVGLLGDGGKYAVYEAPLGPVKVLVIAVDSKSKGPGYPGQTIPKGAVVTGAPPEARQGSGGGSKGIPLPAKYAKSETTPLTFDVKKGEATFDIELAD